MAHGGTDRLEQDLLVVLFESTMPAWASGSFSVSPGWYISLHTADPGTTATTQGASETSYTNYARKRLAQSTTNWSFAAEGGEATEDNDAQLSFAQCGTTGATITHFGIGTTSAGPGILLFRGSLTASLAVSNGITPFFAAGDLNVKILDSA